MKKSAISSNSLCACQGSCGNPTMLGFDSEHESLHEALLPRSSYIRSSSNSSMDLSEGEEAIKRKLKWYFMNPYQKFKDKGRKPWKLLLQIIKIILVTVQAIQFAVDHFAVVSYNSDSIQAFRYLFLHQYDGISTNHDIFTKKDLYGHMYHAFKQYYNMSEAIGSFNPKLHGDTIQPIQICVKRIMRSYYTNGIDPQNDEDSVKNCSYLLPPNAGIKTVIDFVTRNNIPTDFTWVQTMSLNFQLKSINLKEFDPEDFPDCYTFNVTLMFDNNDQDAVFQLYMECTSIFSHCKKGDVNDRKNLKTYILLLDLVVIVSCIISLVLCTRSLCGHLRLMKETSHFFKEYRHDNFMLADKMNFINFWICLTLLSDIFTVIGSVLKITIDRLGISLYDICSIFLGVATVFSWIGVLRYLGYSKNYNVLLVTLKVAFPNIIRFILCATLIYIGFLFCGWIIFGPYHEKFKNLSVTSECLFSLINGDDMFATFSEMDDSNLAIFVFSKIYLYTFIALFIFCVNSLFIGIVSDTYERIKDYGHPPKTRVELFMEGKEYDTPYIARSMNNTPIPDGENDDDIYDGDPILILPRERRHNQRTYKTFN